MARRRIFWHVGPDDLGTTWVADALDAQRDAFEARGVLVPGAPAAWRRLTAEVGGRHRELGLRRLDVTGQTDALTRQMWRHRGPSLLSTPGVAAATAAEAALALDVLTGAEVHLVLVVRPLADQLTAAVQQALEDGATARPARLVTGMLGDGSSGERFRARHDPADIVARWGSGLWPDRIHVLAAPDRQTAWTALLGLAGIDGTAEADIALPALPDAPVLGPDQLAVVRDVAAALDEPDAAVRREVRDWLAREVLVGRPGAGAPVTVADPALLDATVRRWRAALDRQEITVVGDLTLTAAAPAEPDPDPEAAAEALAAAVSELARLRAENDRLRDENQRLDRKRRKHKRRLRALQGRDRDAA